MQEAQRRIALKQHYFHKDPILAAFRELDQATVPLGEIPRGFLHKTQPNSEFESKKRKKIEHLYEVLGQELLDFYPLFVTAIPVSLEYPLDQIDFETQYLLTIIDGHHRERYYPKKLPAVPFKSRIFTVSQMSRLYRANPLSSSFSKFTDEDFFNVFNSWRIEALKSLSDSIPYYHGPPSAKLKLNESGLLIPVV